MNSCPAYSQEVSKDKSFLKGWPEFFEEIFSSLHENGLKEILHILIEREIRKSCFNSQDVINCTGNFKKILPGGGFLFSKILIFSFSCICYEISLSDVCLS